MATFGISDIKEISVENVRDLLKKGEIILVDVRTKGEYEKGKIEDSINIPLDELLEKAETILPNKSEKIYLYCLSGSRSLNAAYFLKQIGYKNVTNVTSGLLAWRAKNYPLI